MPSTPLTFPGLYWTWNGNRSNLPRQRTRRGELARVEGAQGLVVGKPRDLSLKEVGDAWP